MNTIATTQKPIIAADRKTSATSAQHNGDDVLVRVEGVSKKFCRSLRKSLWYGVKDMASELTGQGTGSQNLRAEEFWAVNDVTFQLKRGECLGLIGRNGAGKTTLLKMLNGLIKPDMGRIEMRGRVGALIALGAGFNPILTGRENVYVNGAVLGLTKNEIDEKIDEIIDFSEIGEFIDSPVQSYSSGMNVRLGFSVASTLSPDILILDEVLAVGDIGFTIKCLNRVRALMSNAAVIFVSHTMQFVSSFCTRALVMNRGSVISYNHNVNEAINCYYGLSQTQGSTSGTGGAIVHQAQLTKEDGRSDLNCTEIQQGARVQLLLTLEILIPSTQASVRVYIDDEAQSQLIGYPTMETINKPLNLSQGLHTILLPLGELDLNAGSYSFLVAVFDEHSQEILTRRSGICPFRVIASSTMWCRIVRPVVAKLIP
ncbi:MAG: ABC transporter ATP-binding protein [Fuerstiella sp.]